MTAIVLEHVKVEDLPEAWRARLAKPAGAHVTVRIEEEAVPQQADATGTEGVDGHVDDPAFGIWRDRRDMADVQAYLRELRASRYGREGTRDTG